MRLTGQSRAEEKKATVSWKLDRAVYGLNDDPKKRHERQDKELISLGFVHSKLDTACYISIEGGKLAGIACINVEDTIAAEYKTFKKKVLSLFQNAVLIGKAQKGAFRYVGTNIKQQGNSLTMN